MTFTPGQVLTAAQLNDLDIASLTVDTDTLVVDAATNRVGINQAAPSQALDVDGSVQVDDNLTVDGVVTPGQIDAFDNIDAPTSGNAKFLFGRSSSQAMAMHGSASGNQITSISQTSNPKNLRLKVSKDDGASGYYYTFSDTGLAIGSGSGPAATLDVNGTARATDSITAASGGIDGGIVIGPAFSSSYVGVRTANMSPTGASEYNLLTNGTHTYLSAGSGGDVYIRGGGNSTNPQIFLDTSAQKTTVTGDFHNTGNVVAMYQLWDNVANRSINGNTTLYTYNVTTQGNTRLIMQLVSGQYVKSSSVTNLNIRWSMDGFYLGAGSQYLETNHIGYGANNFREQIVTTANTSTLSAGTHTLRVFAESYGNHTVTLNYQSSARSTHVYIWEVCV